MLINYRVYISAAALILKKVLDEYGFTQFTGETISTAIEITLCLMIILFRKFVGKPLPSIKSFFKQPEKGGLP